jgi:hypothetical protein
MELFVLRTDRLRVSERRFIADHLTRPDSDFQAALLTGEPAGTIAICLDQGEIIGWARSETWQDMPTLEAFVNPAYRRRGVSLLCAAGLTAHGVYQDADVVVVFRQSMKSLADRLRLVNVHFERHADGTWGPA